MDNGNDTASGRSTPRWLKIVLAISLALNFAVIGAVAGAAFRFGGGGSDHGPRAGMAFVAALDKADRRKVLRSVRAVRSVGATPIDTDQILTLLRSPTWDGDAFRTALQMRMDRTRDQQGRVTDVLIETLDAMSPEARAAYADRLEKLRKRRRGKPGRDN